MKKAIKQSTLTFVLNATSIILIVLSMIAFYFIVQANLNLDATNLSRYELYSNAKRFMEGSAYLTNEVRAYAATGDVTHFDNYMNEMSVEKNRDIAVENMRRIGLTYQEQGLIAEMFAISNFLVPLEIESMELAKVGDISNALEAVHGEFYEYWIAGIRANQTEFTEVLNNRTELQLIEASRTVRVLTTCSIVCLLITALIQVISALAVQKKLIYPLLRVRDEMHKIEQEIGRAHV